MRLNNNSIAERRSYPRVDTVLPLGIKAGDFDIVTSTENISCVGAYCRVDKYLAPLTKLDIVLALNSRNKNTKVKCRGVVVRTEPDTSLRTKGGYNIAIYFNGISEKPFGFEESQKMQNEIFRRDRKVELPLHD